MFEGLSIGGFLEVQYLVIFQRVTLDLGHLTELIRSWHSIIINP